MEIKIKNWEKYQKRSDIKRPTWFAVDNGFFDDPKIYELTNSEKLFFIFILCQASKQNDGGKMFFSASFVEERHGFSKEFTKNAIEKLFLLNIIELIESVRDPYAIRTHPYATDRQTDKQTHKNEKLDNNNQEYSIEPKGSHCSKEQDFDFELLYKKYPLKKGKTQGLARLKTMIKTKEQYDQLSKAIDLYADECKKTDPKFIKHFSSFVGTKSSQTWRDWLEATPKKQDKKITFFDEAES